MKYLKSPPGKRIEGLAAETPAAEAASRVFRIRLRAVEQMLPLALSRAGESPEFVHQLRVSTRRADAALRTLGRCLKGSIQRKTRRRLRRIRQSAGIARECDVHMGHFRECHGSATLDAATRGVFNDLIVWTAGQRAEAQREIEEVARRYPIEKLRTARHALLDSIREPRIRGVSGGGVVTLLDMARVTLPPVIGGMRKAVAADLHVLDNLHQLRIAGKRLRYALEIFGACYEGGLRPEYEQVTGLQQELGTINDLHEIILRIEVFATHDPMSSLPGRDDAVHSVIDGYRSQLAEARRHAVADWERGAWTAALASLETALGMEVVPEVVPEVTP